MHENNIFDYYPLHIKQNAGFYVFTFVYTVLDHIMCI